SDGGVGAPPNIGPRRQSAELASEEATISISGVRLRAGLRMLLLIVIVLTGAAVQARRRTRCEGDTAFSRGALRRSSAESRKLREALVLISAHPELLACGQHDHVIAIEPGMDRADPVH